MFSDDDYKKEEERFRNNMLSWIREEKRDILLNYLKFKHFSYEWKIINKRIERLENMMEYLIPDYKLSDSNFFYYVDTIPLDVWHKYNDLDSTMNIYSSMADIIESNCDLAYDFFKDAIRMYLTDIEFISIV